MLRKALCAVVLAAPLAHAGGNLELHVKKLLDMLRVSHVDADMTSMEGKQEFMDRYKMAEKARYELAAILRKKPEAWAWARPGLQKLPRDPARSDVKIRLVEILAHDKDATSRALLVKELKADPKHFPTRAMILMDGNGVAEATETLQRSVRQKPGISNYLAALHLGLKGQASAKPVLEWAKTEPKLNRYLGAQSYGTAVALKRLGDAEAWKEIVQRATNKVEASLDDDDLKTARWYAVQLEFYAKIAKGGKADALMLATDCASYSNKRLAELTNADQVRKLLKSIAA